MKVPEVMQIKTIDYLNGLKKLHDNIDKLVQENISLNNDCENLKNIIDSILTITPKNINGTLYISYQDIIKVCEKLIEKREK